MIGQSHHESLFFFLFKKKTYQLIPPPPIPAIARAITKAHKLVAAPQSNEPIKKTELAKSMEDLRPNTSEIRPSFF